MSKANVVWYGRNNEITVNMYCDGKQSTDNAVNLLPVSGSGLTKYPSTVSYPRAQSEPRARASNYLASC